MTELDDSTPLHLRPLPEATVTDLCDRAERVEPHSYTIRLEVKGFRESRTPWDAMRLANALAYYDPLRAVDPLVRELDGIAYNAAGLLPTVAREPEGSTP